jgi:hypothetical protein
MHDWWCALVVSAFGEVIYDPSSAVLYRQHGRNVVGVRSRPLSEFARKLKVLLRNPRSFYPLHSQASQLLALLGGQLSAERREAVQEFVQSKASPWARVRYALFGRVVRSQLFGQVSARGLILAGLY